MSLLNRHARLMSRRSVLALRRLLVRIATGRDDRSVLAKSLARTTAIRTMLSEIAQSGEIWLPTREPEEFLGPLFLRGMQRLHDYVLDRASSLAEVESDAELLATIRGYFRRVMMGYARKDAYADLRREAARSPSLFPQETASIPEPTPLQDMEAAEEAKRRLLAAIVECAGTISPRDRTIIEHKLTGKPVEETAAELGIGIASLHVAISRLYVRIRVNIPPHLVEDLFPRFKPRPKG